MGQEFVDRVQEEKEAQQQQDVQPHQQVEEQQHQQVDEQQQQQQQDIQPHHQVEEQHQEEGEQEEESNLVVLWEARDGLQEHSENLEKSEDSESFENSTEMELSEKPQHLKKAKIEDNSDSGYSSPTVETENFRLRSERICRFCRNCPIGLVFVPCGHLISCPDCGAKCSECPVCGTEVQNAVRTFMS